MEAMFVARWVWPIVRYGADSSRRVDGVDPRFRCEDFADVKSLVILDLLIATLRFGTRIGCRHKRRRLCLPSLLMALLWGGESSSGAESDRAG
jgi:hypothetical protein